MPRSRPKSGNDMLAVDTNVIVRFLTDDDPAQAAIARRLIGSGPVLLLDSVLLETEWVLRRLYGCPCDRIHHGLTSLVALGEIVLSPTTAAIEALGWYEQGMDFADALHLAAAIQVGCEALATFDRKLVVSARKAGAGGVELL
jgi:predicted nucleic-acid-binding protein